MEKFNNSNLDNQILSHFFHHVQATEVSRKCLQKVFSNNSSNSRVNKQLFEECFDAKFNLHDILKKEKLEKSNN
jgi:hypothetical protein